MSHTVQCVSLIFFFFCSNGLCVASHSPISYLGTRSVLPVFYSVKMAENCFVFGQKCFETLILNVLICASGNAFWATDIQLAGEWAAGLPKYSWKEPNKKPSGNIFLQIDNWIVMNLSKKNLRISCKFQWYLCFCESKIQNWMCFQWF